VTECSDNALKCERSDRIRKPPPPRRNPGYATAHISGHPSAAGRAQDRESSPVRDRRSTTVLRHQPIVCHHSTMAVGAISSTTICDPLDASLPSLEHVWTKCIWPSFYSAPHLIKNSRCTLISIVLCSLFTVTRVHRLDSLSAHRRKCSVHPKARLSSAIPLGSLQLSATFANPWLDLKGRERWE